MTRALYRGLTGCLLLAAIPAACAQFAPPKIKVKYICRSGRYWTSSNGGERHYCFDGVHYSKSTGGVPAFVLQYWEEKERESKEFDEKMSKWREESKDKIAAVEASADRYRQAHGLPSLAEERRLAMERHQELVDRSRARAGLPPRPRPQASAAYTTAASAPTVERSTKPAAQPVRRDLFNVLAAGADRAAVVEALGQPHGAMSNLGADGDEESLTYLVEGGGQANIRLKNGKVLTVRLP